MLVSYVLMVSMSLSELLERRQLRADYPLQSIVDRLAYEEGRALAADPPILGGEVEQRLREFENHGHYSFRSYSLESLHRRTHDDFVMARGFGSVRMLRVRRLSVDLPDTAPIPLPAATPEPESYDPSRAPPPRRWALPERIDSRNPSVGKLLALHDAGLGDFLNRDRMGYIQDRQHVAGFEPHRFSAMPGFGDGVSNTGAWQVARLELVSLLKHETPVAYVSEHLPQMDQLKDALTRPLDRFEQTSLKRLRSDEDLVVEESPHRIRMLGSLRAGKDCLECHSVPRGELLGAFSYELVPERPVHIPKQEVKPPVPQA
jgi:hypothetical protein